LQFIRDTQGSTPDFTVDILSVTVMSNSVKTPKAEMAVSEPGLVVSFRTVGVVTEGVAPPGFDFKNITDAGFKYYFGEFLYRLTLADEFFQPLAAHVDTTTLITLPEVSKTAEKPIKKGQFVAAIMFATAALILAILVAMYAVRKHLQNEQEKLQRLEYPQNTGTMSDGHDEESPFNDGLSDMSATETGTYGQKKRYGYDTRTLQLNIDDEKIEMEEIGLSPVNKPRVNRPSSSSANKPPRPPVCSPTGMEHRDVKEGGAVNDKRTSFGSAFGMKTWLTPRHFSSNQNTVNQLNDQPESEINFQVAANTKKPTNRRSLDPDAVKASTKNMAGKFSDENTVQDISKNDPTSMFTGTTPLSIPVGFFGRNGDTRSDATSNNLDSMIDGSTATSFFSKLAGQKSSVFTGLRNNMQSEFGNSKQSNRFGPATKRDSVKQSPFLLNEQNLAQLQTTSKENVEATIIETSSTFEERRSVFERGSSVSRASSTAVRKTQGAARDEVPIVDTKESKPKRTFEADSVYSEQSELDLNEFGVEATLGAFPPKYDNDNSRKSSFAGHEYGSRPNKASSYVSDGAQSTFSVPSVSTSVSRPNLDQQENRRTSLNTLIKQKDTYDVLAPPGPIGIVVDTSKIGPAVHSLKATSPMLGLINPGDLIVALDGEDTRNMTAASLTRLMAKKSRQKERKITLLSPDGL
jgi:hypothetical protein